MIISIYYSAWRWNVGKRIAMWSHALVLTVVFPRGLEKKITLTFQKYVILDAPRQ